MAAWYALSAAQAAMTLAVALAWRRERVVNGALRAAIASLARVITYDRLAPPGKKRHAGTGRGTPKSRPPRGN